MNDYQYPDECDRITVAYISLHEYIPDYWYNSEQRILRQVENVIIRNFPDKNAVSLLDAGCGEGRLILQFLPVASRIVGLEPDVKRCLKARENVSDEIKNGRVTVLQAGLEYYNTKHQFDITLSSHVIQHIQTGALESYLKMLVKVTKPGGLVVINTNHSCVGREITVLDKISDNGEFVEQEIEREEFNRLTSCCGVLPIRMFHAEELIGQLKCLGLDLVFSNVFHVSMEDQLQYGKDVDDRINEEEGTKFSHGRDISMVLKKR